jgi:hypothetical protein
VCNNPVLAVASATEPNRKMNTALYPVEIKFTRHFTKGWSKGSTYRDSLSFTSRDRAASWLRGVRENVRNGKLDFRITLK